MENLLICVCGYRNIVAGREEIGEFKRNSRKKPGRKKKKRHDVENEIQFLRLKLTGSKDRSGRVRQN